MTTSIEDNLIKSFKKQENNFSSTYFLAIGKFRG